MQNRHKNAKTNIISYEPTYSPILGTSQIQASSEIVFWLFQRSIQVSEISSSENPWLLLFQNNR